MGFRPKAVAERACQKGRGSEEDQHTHASAHTREREHASVSVYLKERGSLDTLSLGDVVRGVVCGVGFGVLILILGVSGGDDDN